METGENYYRCPIALITQETWNMMEHYFLTEKGHLPYSGGYMTQPAYIMTRIKVIASLIARFQELKDQNKERTVAPSFVPSKRKGK